MDSPYGCLLLAQTGDGVHINVYVNATRFIESFVTLLTDAILLPTMYLSVCLVVGKFTEILINC